MDPRGVREAGQVASLTLLGESTPEGKKVKSGKAVMPGGKVIDDATAAQLAAAFDEAGFDRFAVGANPNDAPTGALGVVWISRGNGYESLFFMPGDRRDAATKDRPDVYDALKKLIWTIHLRTPGSMVKVSTGWSGDDLMNQKAGEDR
jgi:hypothetical protein